jgi:cyclic pyranopterin phosphate synthase
LSKLSHIDEQNRPAMVDVSGKAATSRELTVLDGDEINTKKGPVFATAIIAGVMAAKKTHELIPFCHPLGLDDCQVSIAVENDRAIVDCRCKVTHKTGVEMEALTGASVAALTIYDMCKALSHDIVISDTRLMAKAGGKKDFRRDE